MKIVISALFLMFSMTAILSAQSSVSEDKAVIMGDANHPDKGLLY